MISFVEYVEYGDYEHEYRVSLDNRIVYPKLNEICDWGKEYKLNGFILSLGHDDGFFVVGLKSRDLVTEFLLRFS